MPRKKPINTDLTDQSVALAEFAAKALVAAEQLGVKKKPIQDFTLDFSERAIAADLPGLSATLKTKLKAKTGTFTVADTASIVMALAEALLEGETLQRLKLLFISKKLTDCLQTNVVPSVPAKVTAKKSKPTDTVYQFKITLLGAKPAIWRRIQVQDCTLDKLHEYIQAAFGWWSVERIAHEVAVSPRALQLRFSSALGRPISDEIRRLRLTTAQRMLAEPGLRIKNIAKETGLGTGMAMSHLFRRELGISPKEYRKQVLGQREQ